MKKIAGTFLALLTLLLQACVQQQITKQEAFPDMYQEKPLSILVLPAVNESTAADAPELYSSTIAQPLANSGYYVFPIEITNAVLAAEGIQDGAQLRDVPAQKFGAMFGTDSVLYVTVTKWDTAYYVIGGHVTVGMQFRLVSTSTGESLWAYNYQKQLDTSGDANAGLFVALVATAISTATQDYVPVARQANFEAIQALPVGKYHNQYGEDGALKAVVPAFVGAEK